MPARGARPQPRATSRLDAHRPEQSSKSSTWSTLLGSKDTSDTHHVQLRPQPPHLTDALDSAPACLSAGTHDPYPHARSSRRRGRPAQLLDRAIRLNLLQNPKLA